MTAEQLAKPCESVNHYCATHGPVFLYGNKQCTAKKCFDIGLAAGRERIAELEAALKPFADLAMDHSEYADDSWRQYVVGEDATVGDYRRAAEAMKGTP